MEEERLSSFDKDLLMLLADHEYNFHFVHSSWLCPCAIVNGIFAGLVGYILTFHGAAILTCF